MENFYQGENDITNSIVGVLRRDTKDKNALWVSDIGKCRRMIWYSWQNTPKTEKIDEVILKLNLGNFIHEGLSNTLMFLLTHTSTGFCAPALSTYIILPRLISG